MGVEFKDYYNSLGVDRKASTEEISRAYKQLARKHHPDLNPKNKEEAEEKFKEINEAHEVLKDPEKRAMYDQLGPNWKDGQNFQPPPGFENIRFDFGGGQGGFGGSGFSDFFETIFGGQGNFQGGFGGGPGGYTQSNYGGSPFGNYANQPRKGRDIEASLSLSLTDAYLGGKKTISIGGGKSLEVNIPAGIKKGARIRLAGQGDPGINKGKAGDLFLKINITPHADFILDDSDIEYELDLAPWEAVLGCTVRVPTLDGEVDLKVAPGTDSGKKLRLRGKGLGQGKAKGDQFVRIAIVMPESLSEKEKELWEELEKISTFKARE